MVRKSLLSIAVASTALTVWAGEAELLVKNSGVRDGLVVVLGCDDPALPIGIAKTRPFLVHCLDADATKVAAARKAIQDAGLYGRVSVQQWDREWLPYASSLANLVVVRCAMRDAGPELLRVLAPRGVALFSGKSDMSDMSDMSDVSDEVKLDGWRAWAKAVPPGIDDWTHFLHGPDNNPVANDTLVAQPRELRWIAGPRWAWSHEEFASVSAVVSSKGRIFYIQDEAPLATIRFPGDWRLVARDAFNGLKLWSKPVKPWNDHLRHFRSGPAHLARRLVADGDRVFVTLGLDAPVTELNAATGDLVRTFKGTEHAEEIVFDGKTLYLVVGTSEAKRSGGGLFQRGEPKPSADRFIAAIDADSGKELWRMSGKATAEGYNTPAEIFVVGDTAWVKDVPSDGYNLRTGAPKSITGKGAAVGMMHHRCCRNKATTKYLFTGRDGIEVVDFEKGWIGNNSWVRGVCQYGILLEQGTRLRLRPRGAKECRHGPQGQHLPPLRPQPGAAQGAGEAGGSARNEDARAEEERQAREEEAETQDATKVLHLDKDNSSCRQGDGCDAGQARTCRCSRCGKEVGRGDGI